MKKMVLSNILILTIAFGFFFSFQLGTTQAEPKSTKGVYPFFTSAGYMGFFDTTDGMYYLYDANLEKCLMQKELTQLGQPAKTIFNTFSGQSGKREGVY